MARWLWLLWIAEGQRVVPDWRQVPGEVNWFTGAELKKIISLYVIYVEYNIYNDIINDRITCFSYLLKSI